MDDAIQANLPEVTLYRGQTGHFQRDDSIVRLPEHVRPDDGPLSRMREAGKQIAVEDDSSHAKPYTLSHPPLSS